MRHKQYVVAALPWLSPKHFEVNAFRSTYLSIMLVVVAFMAYWQALMLWAALSKPVDMTRAILGALFLMFVLLGNVLSKVRRNFYVGVRTPWTLANEKVWHATHRFAAKSFVIGGLAGLVFVVLGAGAIAMFVIFPIPGLSLRIATEQNSKETAKGAGRRTPLISSFSDQALSCPLPLDRTFAYHGLREFACVGVVAAIEAAVAH